MKQARTSTLTEARKPSVERLLDAAERLLGMHGLDGVSLRQIGNAAGSANNFAVQYHFGDIDGLIQAILSRRMPVVDARQSEMLQMFEAEGRGDDPRALIDAFLRPILEQLNGNDERAYARFITALLRSPQGRVHCKRLFHLTPMTLAIRERLSALNPHLSLELLDERLRWLSGMVCTSVFNRVEAFPSSEKDALLIDDALAIAAVGLALPSHPMLGSGRGDCPLVATSGSVKL